MIISQLNSGLGNQMFQYALGRRISYINKVPFKLDINEFNINIKGIAKRKYELHVFNIQEHFASPEEIERLIPKKRLMREFAGTINKIIPYYRNTYIRQKYHHFNHEVLKLKDNIYLEGYWQSEKYFQDIKDIIRKDFTFKTEASGLNKEILKKINKEQSVGIHIRRGDYVYNKRLFLCPAEYYITSMERVKKTIENPHFFIFSTEPDWAKKNIKAENITFITHNGPEKGSEDLRLLSSCKHFIIANSTFSWWGAWLGKYVKKIVFAPKTWFKVNVNTKDLIPEGWIKI